MSTNHNRIKIADLETSQPNKTLVTNENGELEFSDISNIKIDSYNALDYTLTGKSLDARQGKILKDLIDNINALLASDNINLNTLQELVDAIGAIQNSLNTILVNDLSSGGASKALTAEMGKILQNNKVDKVTGERLIKAAEITKLSGLTNVNTTVKTIPSSALPSQNVVGFVTYINTLNPVLLVGTNEIVKYTISDTGQTFELNLRGRSFGVGQQAIVTTDVIEITGFLNKDIRLGNYPNTRNDGQLLTNKVLSTDANGNLKMYTIATAQAPFLEISALENILLPSTTTNFVLKGAFFTPTMTVSIIGQTVNYITFVNDNLIKVNVTTGATEGSYAVTLNNGISTTYNNALLVILGTVYIPATSDFVNLIQPIAVEDGSVLLKTVNSYGTAQLPYTFNFAKKFRIYYSHKVSPLWNPTGEIRADFIRITDLVNGNYWDLYLHTNNSTYSEYQLFKNGVVGGFNGLGWASPTYLNRDVFFYWDLTQMYIYVNNSLQWTFPVGEFPNPIKVAFKVSKMDIKNIKYVELAS